VKAYTLTTVRQLIEIYNKTRSAEDTAFYLRMAAQDVRYILQWLYRHDPQNEHRDALTKEFNMQPPVALCWLYFLYTHNVDARVAAACVGWPHNHVIKTCGGPENWNRTENRPKPRGLKTNSDNGEPHENEEEELSEIAIANIARRMQEVRAGWSAAEKERRYTRKHEHAVNPVEIRQFITDRRRR